MPDKIRPSEVSEVLLQQLKGINTSIQFDEVGAVLQVSDGVARIYGLLHAEANELLEFENGVMGVVMNLEEDNVGAVLQILGDVVLDREILDLAEAHEVQAAQFAAHEHEFGGAFVLDQPVVAEAAGQSRKGHLRQGHGGHEIAQGGPHRAVLVDGLDGLGSRSR